MSIPCCNARYHALAEEQKFGLRDNHEYSIIDTVTLTDGRGREVEKLIKMRNPFGTNLEEAYRGEWWDRDSRWTSSYRAQINASCD